jgi:Rod binding domain-containing protein
VSIAPVLSPSLTQAGPPLASTSKDTLAKIQHAAADFEALLLAQMLKSSRESSGGSLTGTDDGEANSTMIELGEQQFAQALASSGGLGIAKMVVTGLAKNADR